jgi:hypothetical protein
LTGASSRSGFGAIRGGRCPQMTALRLDFLDFFLDFFLAFLDIS